MHFSSFATKFLESVTTGTPKANERLGLDIAKIVGRNLGIHGIMEFERDGKFILGGGNFGVAGVSAEDENKVVKLTTDPEEVMAASVLVGKRLIHVVEFFSAAYISDIRATNVWTGLRQRIGISVMERLDEVGVGTAKHGLLDEIVERVKREFKVTPEQVMRMSSAMARERLAEASLELASRLQATGDNDLAELAEGVDELYAHGVYAVDFHPGNVGWSNRDGVYKVFDLGLSSAPKGFKPKVLKNPREGCVVTLMSEEDCWPMHTISTPEHSVPVIY